MDCLKAIDKSNCAKWIVLNEIQTTLRDWIFDALNQSIRPPVCVGEVKKVQDLIILLKMI